MGYWEWKEWATGSGGNRRWVRERKDCRWATGSGGNGVGEGEGRLLVGYWEWKEQEVGEGEGRLLVGYWEWKDQGVGEGEGRLLGVEVTTEYAVGSGSSIQSRDGAINLT